MEGLFWHRAGDTDHCAILSPFISVALSEVVREKRNQLHVWSMHLPLNSEAHGAVIHLSHSWRRLSCHSYKSQEDYLFHQEFFQWNWAVQSLELAYSGVFLQPEPQTLPRGFGHQRHQGWLVCRGRFFTWLPAPISILVIKIVWLVKNGYELFGYFVTDQPKIRKYELIRKSEKLYRYVCLCLSLLSALGWLHCKSHWSKPEYQLQRKIAQ